MSYQPDSIMLDRLPGSLEVQKAVASSLQTLESIDRGSLMNRKGRQCLQRLLDMLEMVGKLNVLPLKVD